MNIVLEVPCFAKRKQPHGGTGLVSRDPLLRLEGLPEADSVRFGDLGPHPNLRELAMRRHIPFLHQLLGKRTFRKKRKVDIPNMRRTVKISPGAPG